MQAARESARLTTCKNHVSQLAKAMIRHETSLGHFLDGMSMTYLPGGTNAAVTAPTAFGSPHRAGFTMTFRDGSVRTLPFEIDQAVHLVVEVSCTADADDIDRAVR